MFCWMLFSNSLINKVFNHYCHLVWEYLLKNWSKDTVSKKIYYIRIVWVATNGISCIFYYTQWGINVTTLERHQVCLFKLVPNMKSYLNSSSTIPSLVCKSYESNSVIVLAQKSKRNESVVDSNSCANYLLQC